MKELEGFDFEAQPSHRPQADPGPCRIALDRQRRERAAPGAAGRRQDAPGMALGREAILAGYTVLFTSAMALVAGLAKAHGEDASRRSCSDTPSRSC